MTKLRHGNPPHWGPDPGAVRSVPDTTRPCSPLEDRTQRAADRAEANRARKTQSEQHDMALIVAPALARGRKRFSLGLPLSSWERAILNQYGWTP